MHLAENIRRAVRRTIDPGSAGWCTRPRVKQRSRESGILMSARAESRAGSARRKTFRSRKRKRIRENRVRSARRADLNRVISTNKASIFPFFPPSCTWFFFFFFFANSRGENASGKARFHTNCRAKYEFRFCRSSSSSVCRGKASGRGFEIKKIQPVPRD